MAQRLFLVRRVDVSRGVEPGARNARPTLAGTELARAGSDPPSGGPSHAALGASPAAFGSPPEWHSDFAVFGTTGNVYECSVRARPTCTCPDFVGSRSGSSRAGSHVCKHLMWVYMRVLGVSRDDPALCQVALLQSELAAMLSRPSAARARRSPPRPPGRRTSAPRDCRADRRRTRRLPFGDDPHGESLASPTGKSPTTPTTSRSRRRTTRNRSVPCVSKTWKTPQTARLGLSTRRACGGAAAGAAGTFTRGACACGSKERLVGVSAVSGALDLAGARRCCRRVRERRRCPPRGGTPRGISRGHDHEPRGDVVRQSSRVSGGNRGGSRPRAVQLFRPPRHRAAGEGGEAAEVDGRGGRVRRRGRRNVSVESDLKMKR